MYIKHQVSVVSKFGPNSLPMRKNRFSASALVAIAVLAAALPVRGQETSMNRLTDGDFESGFVSLSLPPLVPFPVFFGGWTSRGDRRPEIVPDAFEGTRALRVSTRPDDPTQVIQDLPLNGTGVAVSFAFLIESGSQTIRLATDWNRRDTWDGEATFEATISEAGLSFSTPAGRWELNARIAPQVWHRLSIVADPRQGTQSVRLDGRQVASLPGLAMRRASTLLIAAGARDQGTFRYDSVETVSLVDLEISALRDATRTLDPSTRAPVLERLGAAQSALQRGAPTLALPELGVVHSLLRSAAQRADAMLESAADEPSATDLSRLQRAVADLIELIEADA